MIYEGFKYCSSHLPKQNRADSGASKSKSTQPMIHVGDHQQSHPVMNPHAWKNIEYTPGRSPQHSMNLLPLSYLRLQADSTDEAPWQWANGANFTYANWGAGEPSGGTEDCAHMQSGTFSIRKKTRMSCCQRISLRNSEDCLIHAK